MVCGKPLYFFKSTVVSLHFHCLSTVYICSVVCVSATTKKGKNNIVQKKISSRFSSSLKTPDLRFSLWLELGMSKFSTLFLCFRPISNMNVFLDKYMYQEYCCIQRGRIREEKSDSFSKGPTLIRKSPQ